MNSQSEICNPQSEIIRVLLIEDNEDDALIIREILAQATGAPFDLEWADRLATGLARLAKGGIDVVLTDLGLPDSQGLDTCTTVHAQAPDVPIVVLTGLEDTGLAVQAVQAGAQDYLVKGQIDSNLLVRAMRYAIERQQLLVELEQKTQELLQASETRFRTIIEKNADGIVIVDGNGMVRFLNPAAEDLFGRQAEDLVGELFGFPMVGRETTEVQIIRRGGETAVAEMRVVETEWEGEFGYLASLRDITERVQRERELEAIVTVATALRAAPTRAEMFPVILDEVLTLLQGGGAALTMRDPATGETVIELGRGGWADWTGVRLAPGEGVSGHVIATGRPYISDDARNDPLVARPDLIGDLHATACVPLIAQEQTIGAVWVGHQTAISKDEVRLLTAVAAMTANAIQRAGLFEQLERRVSELAILYEMDRRMAASLHVRDIQDFAVQSIPRVIGAEACSLLLWDEWEKALIVRAGEGWPTEYVGKARYRQGEGLVGWVFLERRAANVPDVSADPRWQSKYREDEKLPSGRARCALAVPLILGKKTLGVLSVVNKIPLPTPAGVEGPGVSAFTEADEAILTSVAGQMAVALENARLYEDVRDLSIATIRSLATAIDARDPYTRGHSEGVTRLAVQLARELGWDGADLEMLEFAALLHDVGKIAVPDAILRKPGPLTSEEWDVMHRHPYYSRQIVAPVEPLRRLTPWMYHHHERWDGTGYPDGLKGDAIPLAARIIAVADVWDALRSDRPYRKAWPEEKAWEHIREQAGKHFDPRVVEVFLELLRGNESTR